MSSICIFAKVPLPGRTKSRLAATIGNDNAAALSRAMLADLATIVGGMTNVNPMVWHPPTDSQAEFGDLVPARFSFHEQVGDNLGARMAHAFATTLQAGHGPALIIGSDCITHSVATLNDALTLLQTHDVVVQPANDGGYVLIGQSTSHPAMFKAIDWGSHRVWQQTQDILGTLSIRYATMPPTFDIDTASDIEELRDFLAVNSRPHTAACIASRL